MEGTEGRSAHRPLEEVLKEVCEAAGKEGLNIEELIKDNSAGEANLTSWLNRLGFMADFKNKGESAKRYAVLVYDTIKLAKENMEFRSIFFATILEAGGTCGDRVALSILRLHLQYEIHTCKDPRRLAVLILRGLWTLNFLESAAENKLRTLRISDPIETYLAYPVKLATKVFYPLPVPEMLYFPCSGVTNKDLELAKKLVLERLAPENWEEQAQFLSEQEEWHNLYQPGEVVQAKNTLDQISKEMDEKKGEPTPEETEKWSRAHQNLENAKRETTQAFLKEHPILALKTGLT